MADADFVVGVLPLTPSSIGFFTKDIFAKMKQTAVFMNVGRGKTVNEADLVHALQQGTIGGAVLDVFEAEPLPEESPLWSMSNVLLYPHTADYDRDYMERAFS